ncbi:hypothetical protein E2C01_049028 [Portunus trituberculatus]|uniref:Uncharacterized protein n=1 Tax=Portunus trituberculatus TaxID=210409 RepID=A0A5B7GEX8_PORTR|nr:hypothetical protein [Portunus trituberculatus]
MASRSLTRPDLQCLSEEEGGGEERGTADNACPHPHYPPPSASNYTRDTFGGPPEASPYDQRLARYFRC